MSPHSPGLYPDVPAPWVLSECPQEVHPPLHTPTFLLIHVSCVSSPTLLHPPGIQTSVPSIGQPRPCLLSICPPTRLSTHPPIHPPTTHPAIHPFTYSPICPPTHPSIHPFVYLLSEYFEQLSALPLLGRCVVFCL